MLAQNVMSEIVASSEIATISPARVDGLPKSGRFWKKKQVFRSSATLRKGALSHLCQTLEERNEKKLKDKVAKDLEKEMVEATKRKKQEERQRREEQDKRRMANEFKTTSFQEVCQINLRAIDLV